MWLTFMEQIRRIQKFLIKIQSLISEDYISNFYLKYCIHSFQKERCVAKTISAVMTFWTLAKPGSPQILVEVSNKKRRRKSDEFQFQNKHYENCRLTYFLIKKFAIKPALARKSRKSIYPLRIIHKRCRPISPIL